MITEAIVLAGGLGTRLRAAVPDLPKCMAPVAGRPFLSHVIHYFRKQGIQRFIFSLGYKHELIEDYLDTQSPDLDYSCVIEKEPIGTGGAVLKSASMVRSKNTLVLNGDTLFAVDLQQISSFHEQMHADCTLSLKAMTDSDRYGVVEINEDGKIQSFKEKKWYAEAIINGGVYALNTTRFLQLPFPPVFSFEKDFLEKYYAGMKLYGLIQPGYFIDIGIPEDFNRAQTELKSE